MDTEATKPNASPVLCRVTQLIEDHPEAAVLASTGAGVIAGVLLSSIVDSDASMQRGKSSSVARKFVSQLLEPAGGVSSTALTSLRDLIKR